MDSKTSPPDDENRTIRCPRLGHNIGFSYCRIENNGRPCFKAIDCWFEHFDVHSYFKSRLSIEEMEQIFCQPPKPKMLSLLELIQRAQANQTEKKSV